MSTKSERPYLRKFQACSIQNYLKLLLRLFLPVQHHHREIEPVNCRICAHLRPFWHDHISDDQPGRWSHGVGDILQYLDADRLVEIMEDSTEEIYVGI